SSMSGWPPGRRNCATSYRPPGASRPAAASAGRRSRSPRSRPGASIPGPRWSAKTDLRRSAIDSGGGRRHTGSVKQSLIIDCDPGVDDATGLLTAFASPDLDLLAVTTVGGNVSAAKTARNARILRHIAGREDVPVYRGA